MIACHNIVRLYSNPIPTQFSPLSLTAALARVGLHNWVTTSKDNAEGNRSNNISKFLNRILGIPVTIQNHLFQYFTDTLAATISEAKRLGRFDYGIQDLGARGEEVTLESVQKYTLKHATGVAPIEMHTVTVDRGLTWDDAIQKLVRGVGETGEANENEGFYLPFHGSTVNLVTHAVGDKYQIFRPNTGLQSKCVDIAEIKRLNYKIPIGQAQAPWQKHYDFSKDKCSHLFFKGSCGKKIAGIACDHGLRKFTHNVLSGAVLSVWTKVEGVMARHYNKPKSLQVLRVKSGDTKIVGISIPKTCVYDLDSTLKHAEAVLAEEEDDEFGGGEDSDDSYDEY